jgi:hypothetical protein
MPSDTQFGGRITFEFAGQTLAFTEAQVTIVPSNVKADSKANQDGSPCYMYSPTLMGANFKLRDAAGINWSQLMRQSGNCTITEADNGVTHLFTACRLVGEPTENRADGEVDGLQIRGGQYQKLTGQ